MKNLLFIVGVFILSLQCGIAQEPTAQWENITTSSIEGTRTTCMAEGKNGAIMLGSIGGVYRSDDMGISWKKVNNGIPVKPTLAMCATPDGIVYISVDTSVFRSFDNGDSWVRVTNNINPKPVGFLYAYKDGRVFAGPWGALFVTKDSGTTWQSYDTYMPRNNNENPNCYGCIAFGKYNRIFATIGYGMQISTNDGASWSIWKGFKYAVTTEKSDYLIIEGRILYENATFGLNDLGRIDNGTNSYLINPLLELQQIQNYSSNLAGYSGFYRSTLILDSGKFLVGLINFGIDGVYRSIGVHWLNYKNKGMKCRLVNEIFQHSSGSIFAGTIGGGVYRSNDKGNSWTEGKTGLTDAYITYIHNDTKRNRILAATGCGMYYTTDKGSTWTNCSKGLENYSIFKVAQSSTHYFALGWTGLYKCRIDSLVWSRVYILGVNDSVNYNDVDVGLNDSIVVGLHYLGAFLSVDNGIAWKNFLNNEVSIFGVKYNKINHSWYTGVALISKTTNGGKDWSLLTDGTLGGSPARLFKHDADNRFYTMCSKGFTWLDETLDPPKFTSLTGNSPKQIFDYYSNNLSQIYALNNVGIYRMWNADADWRNYGVNLPSTQCASLALDNEGYLYVGTMGKGIYRTKETTDKLYPAAQRLPVNKAKEIITNTVKFEWDSIVSARAIHLQVSLTPDMNNPVVNDSAIKGLTKNVLGLRSNKEYFWRIKSKHKTYSSEWSPVWSFITASKVPAKIQLDSPPTLNKVAPTIVTLKWHIDDNAERYQVHVSDIDSKDIIVDDSTITDTTLHVTILPKHSYQWKVSAIGSKGKGEWSDTWIFTAEEMTDVEYGVVNQVDIQPIPAKEFILITAEDFKRSLHYKIIDLTGCFVVQTDDNPISLYNLENGMYILEIQNGSRKIYKKFIVLK